MNSQQCIELAALCRSIRWDVDMAAYSTFRTGGVVEAMVEVSLVEELGVLLRWLHREQVPWHVIGGGSNILVTSLYHKGVFIRLRGTIQDVVAEPAEPAGMAPTDQAASVRVRVHAGCSLAAFLGWCARNGLGGLEFMAGIPGSVGGAIRMNAGALGHAVSDALESVDCMTSLGESITVAREAAVFTYRSTRLPGEPAGRMLITSGVFRLQPVDGQQVAARCREIVDHRKQNQPQGVGSAGSFFKNPKGDFAGRLIERAGLKGLMHGKAMVSPKHANFIVNTGGAVPEDIISLMEQVRRKVLQHSGVLLEPEVHIY
jgi:UDP-N-acetylmuramate dehydrogenase